MHFAVLDFLLHGHDLHIKLYCMQCFRMSQIILTRCQLFHLKCINFNVGWGFAPDPAAGAQSVPRLPISIWGGEEKEKTNGREGKRRGREKGKGS